MSWSSFMSFFFRFSYQEPVRTHFWFPFELCALSVTSSSIWSFWWYVASNIQWLLSKICNRAPNSSDNVSPASYDVGFLANNELRGWGRKLPSPNVRNYLKICLERLRRYTRNLSLQSRSPVETWKPGTSGMPSRHDEDSCMIFGCYICSPTKWKPLKLLRVQKWLDSRLYFCTEIYYYE
jgi:hypothetical protein